MCGVGQSEIVTRCLADTWHEISGLAMQPMQLGGRHIQDCNRNMLVPSPGLIWALRYLWWVALLHALEGVPSER